MVQAAAAKSDLQDAVKSPGVSAQDFDELNSRMKTSSTLADATLIGGGVAFVTGLVLVLTSGSSTRASKSAIRAETFLRAVATPRAYALQGSF
jgi:hypothetical protein